MGQIILRKKMCKKLLQFQIPSDLQVPDSEPIRRSPRPDVRATAEPEGPVRSSNPAGRTADPCPWPCYPRRI